ncbi:hypothetical protein GF314_07045 [bacterium]|nr:hypothetical protein [bacterium]
MDSREAALHLTDYVLGDLDTERRAAVAAAVAADPELHDLETWLRQLHRLLQMAGARVLAHPDGDRIVAFALDPDHADPETAAHAVACPTCREHVASTRVLHGELVGTSAAGLWRRAVRAMRGNGAGVIVGLAAALLVIVLGNHLTAPAPTPLSGAARTVLIDGAVRGGQPAEPTVARAGAASIVLLIDVDPAVVAGDRTAPLDVSLARDGEEVWRWTGPAATAWNEDLALLSLSVATETLAPGRHDLVVRVGGEVAMQRTLAVTP